VWSQDLFRGVLAITGCVFLTGPQQKPSDKGSKTPKNNKTDHEYDLREIYKRIGCSISRESVLIDAYDVLASLNKSISTTIPFSSAADLRSPSGSTKKETKRPEH
jgi:hypothetical protein